MEIMKTSDNHLLVGPIALAVKDYLTRKKYSYPFKKISVNSSGALFVIERKKRYQIFLPVLIENEKSLIAIKGLDNNHYAAAYLYRPFAFKDVNELGRKIGKTIDEDIVLKEVMFSDEQ